MADEEGNAEEVEQEEPKIILTQETIQEGLSNLMRTPSKYTPSLCDSNLLFW